MSNGRAIDYAFLPGLATHAASSAPRRGVCGTFAPFDRITTDERCVSCFRCRRSLRAKKRRLAAALREKGSL